jgi:hypothetical protein
VSESFYKPKKKKKFNIDTKKMGVNIDKNEYYTIKETPENYPDKYFK